MSRKWGPRMGPTRSGSIYSICIFLATLLAALQPSEADSLVSAVQKLKIPHEIIAEPNDLTVVQLKLNRNPINPGDSVPAKNLKELDLSQVSWGRPTTDSRYTLVLLDLDRRAPLNNSLNIFNQYTSINIPGDYLIQGMAVIAFDPPIVPCSASSKHRLAVLAYHQQQNIDIGGSLITSLSGQTKGRENFNLDEFVRRHRLKLVAANVFQAVGETGGVCSGAASAQTRPSALLLAVAAGGALFGLANRKWAPL